MVEYCSCFGALTSILYFPDNFLGLVFCKYRQYYIFGDSHLRMQRHSLADDSAYLVIAVVDSDPEDVGVIYVLTQYSEYQWHIYAFDRLNVHFEALDVVDTVVLDEDERTVI